MTPGDPTAALKDLLDRASFAVAFTGAGISTESGVPDFRSPNSPWMRHKPIPFEAFLRSGEARREAWRRKFAMDDLYSDAKPNRGHRALAALMEAGRLEAVITQNVDGLHQASGVPADRLVELHGNGTYAACLACRRRHELDWVRAHLEAAGEPPSCEACGGIVKSATISFGQAMPEAPLRRAQELALSCDLFIVLGSSLVVFPAASLPEIAKRNGASLVIVNRDPTRLDDAANLVIHGEIGSVLEPFLPKT
jgi:NAD-dependent deacetylase